MKSSLTQTFNKSAAAAHAAYPHELKDLVILLIPSSDTPVYVAPAIAARLTKDTAEIRKSVADLALYMHERNAAGLAHKSYELGGTPVNLIALTTSVKGFFSAQYTEDMRVILNLDHEMGHHILKNGYPVNMQRSVRQHAEAVADAFAILRHIQRFGKDTDQAGFYGESRAYAIVLVGDTEHYTTNTVRKTLEIANKKDIAGLSLKETVKLAEKIALECHLDDATLEKIRKAYEPVAQACRMQIGSAFDVSEKLYAGDKEAYMLFCRATLAAMIKHMDDADIFRAGKQFLGYPPIRDFMAELAKTDPVWEKARGFVESYEPAQQPAARKSISPKI